LWLHSLKVAQLLRSAACLHTNQPRSYLNHLVLPVKDTGTMFNNVLYIIIIFQYKASCYKKIVVYKVKEIHTGIFCVVIPSNLVSRYQRFEEIYCLHLQFINSSHGGSLLFKNTGTHKIDHLEQPI